MGNIVPVIFQIPFFKGTSRHHFAILLSISPLHDDGLIADLQAEGEQCEDLIDEIAPLSLGRDHHTWILLGEKKEKN